MPYPVGRGMCIPYQQDLLVLVIQGKVTYTIPNASKLFGVTITVSSLL